MQPCYHCGLNAEPAFCANINGLEQMFCCLGCQAIAQTIHGAGLAQFYQFRQGQSATATASDTQYAHYDSPTFLAQYGTPTDADATAIYLGIDDIRCAACVWLIEQHLQRLAGVQQVQGLLGSKRVKVVWRQAQTPLSKVFAALHAIGYQATVYGGVDTAAGRGKELLRLGVAGFGMMQVGMYSIALYAGAWQGISDDMRLLLRLGSAAVATLVLVLSAWPFFSNAIKALRNKHVVMDVPIATAIGLAYSASIWATINNNGEVYFDSVTMFTFFILLSRFIESRVNQRYREQVQGRYTLQTVKRVQADQTYAQASDVNSADLQAGDTIWLAAGETLPVDAQLVSAHAEFDESVVSGEPLPVLRRQGETVFAGSVNGNSLIQLVVLAVGHQTRLSTLQQLQFEAESLRPRWATVANSLAAVFVFVVLVLASLSYVVWRFIDPAQALWIALSVLVVSCPCALSLATPTVYTAALSRLRAQGILLRDGRYIERLANISDVVFDKTGTLTQGRLHITQLSLLGPHSRAQVLAIAAALEQGAHHPIATAFSNASEAPQMQLDRPATFVTGGGVEGVIAGQAYALGSAAFITHHTGLAHGALTATSDTLTVYLAGKQGDSAAPSQWQLLACFSFSDTLRPEAPSSVQQLGAQGLTLAIFSGDSSQAVATVATTLGIATAHQGMSADQKLKAIKAMQAQAKIVMSVGDGLNDLPFLGGADVSVAVASASDLTLQHANINLLRSDLRLLPVLIQTARLAMRRLRQNIVWALAYNSIMIPLAMAGFIAPWLAALGMSLSSLVVVINARRLSIPAT